MKLRIESLQSPDVTEDLTKAAIKELEFYWIGDGLDKNKIEQVDCSLCGAVAPKENIFTKARFPYKKCPKCGLVYPSPRPASSHIKEQYVSGRFSSTFENLYLPTADYRMKTIFRERVVELIQPKVPAGKLLDIGCSSGHFLKVAFQHGFDVYGIEPNPDMVAFATNHLKLPNIYNGVMPNPKFHESMFDVVTLWDVLEHVENPASVLEQARRVLKPGGWIFAYTENFASYNIFVTGKYSEMVTPDVHLRHYTPKTFSQEFESAGFEISKVYTEGLDVGHILKTFKTFPEEFSGIDLEFPESFRDGLQEFISKSGFGDNLRLIAQNR